MEVTAHPSIVEGLRVYQNLMVKICGMLISIFNTVMGSVVMF